MNVRFSFKCVAIAAVVFATSVISVSTASAQDQPAPKLKLRTTPKVDSKQISYFLGVSVGQDLARNGLQGSDFLDKEFLEGLRDGIERKEKLKLSDQELMATKNAIDALLQKRITEMRTKMMAEMKVLGEKNAKEGKEFLAANAKKPGVKQLTGGLQYKVLKAGDGKTPAATDTVAVHYTGKLLNGTMFDTSRKSENSPPAKLRVNELIKGWQIALQNMKVGSKWMLYIPSELAYADQIKPVITPNSTLVFELELVGIQ
ncbi:MAG: FKBP-type peptidyl-prolyl cis-trans isomerase [Planctomycetota bacterium]